MIPTQYSDNMVHAYMDTAKRFAQLSKAKRLQVGAIIVKENRIISIGYNGTPARWSNDCEDVLADGTLKTKPEVIHAEMNAIGKLARSGESGDGAYMFLTHAPCMECAKLIFVAGITKVWFNEHYRDTSGVDFLRKCNIHTQLGGY